MWFTVSPALASKMELNPQEFFRVPRRILSIFGIWPVSSKSLPFFFYINWTSLICSSSFGLFHSYANRDDLFMVLDSLTPSITEVVSAIKISMFFYYRKDFGKILNQLFDLYMGGEWADGWAADHWKQHLSVKHNDSSFRTIPGRYSYLQKVRHLCGVGRVDAVFLWVCHVHDVYRYASVVQFVLLFHKSAAGARIAVQSCVSRKANCLCTWTLLEMVRLLQRKYLRLFLFVRRYPFLDAYSDSNYVWCYIHLSHGGLCTATAFVGMDGLFINACNHISGQFQIIGTDIENLTAEIRGTQLSMVIFGSRYLTEINLIPQKRNHPAVLFSMNIKTRNFDGNC